MAQPLGGTGLGLPSPQALYPVTLTNAPYTAPTNSFDLVAAGTLVVPAGQWVVAGGTVSAIQWFDPVQQMWINMTTLGAAFAMVVKSDGFNFRVANLSGAAYAATVGAAGTGYAQATTTITAGTGNSTWRAIVGGALGTFTIVAGGAGYSMPPNVFLPAPPSPGVAATATAALTSGAVSGITIRNAGAGYLTAPPVTIVPNPFDPNFLNGTITSQATATVALAGAGTLTAAQLVNFGQSLSAGPTLTVSGAGSSATALTTPLTASWVAPANDVITMQPSVGP